MRTRLALGVLAAAWLMVLAGCARPPTDACGTCTEAPTALCDQGACKPRLPERPDPHIEDTQHQVTGLPFETVAAWPLRNAVAGHFVQTLLSGAGVPQRQTGLKEWQDLSVPEPLAPKARRILDRAISSGQPGREPTATIPTDSPPHLAFKVIR
jgi:hypothetical protein